MAPFCSSCGRQEGQTWCAPISQSHSPHTKRPHSSHATDARRVLPCFEVSVNTLAIDYKQRNRWFGPREHCESEAAFKRMERSLATQGPMPPIGLRAALWEGL